MRAPAPLYKDKVHFARTASRTKAVNLGNVAFRGGIRF